MYEMHGQLIIISVTTPPSLCFQKSKVVAGLNLKYFSSTTQIVTEPYLLSCPYRAQQKLALITIGVA